MKAFAAAGLIAAASAASSEATPTPSFKLSDFFDASQFYSYGAGSYAYPEFDHKEEHTPHKHHPKKSAPYKTHNIDIFAHSSSDSEHKHHRPRKYKKHHSSHSSSSDTSEDEKKPKKKHHRVFLTGYGPKGDHCHEGDYCGKVKDPYSDYSDSDYSNSGLSEEEEHIKYVSGCGGELCARVDFDWNYLGIEGTMDIFQPYGSNPNLLFDGDWDGLSKWQRHEVALMSLPKQSSMASMNRPDFCGDTGRTKKWIGSTKADSKGNGSLRTFQDGLCLEDFIGNSVEIRGTYSNYNRNQLKVLACGNVRQVPCPGKHH